MKTKFISYSLATFLFIAVAAFFADAEGRHFWGDWLLWYEPVLAGAVCGLLCALLGVYLFLNRIVFMSLAVSQGAGFGIFCAFLFAPYLGVAAKSLSLPMGFLMALGVTLLFGLRRKSHRTTDESYIGLIYAILSGLIVMVGDRIREGHHEIDNLLFGNAVAVATEDFFLLCGGAFLLTALHITFRREFVYASADPDFMKVRGMPVGFWKVLLFITLSVGITLAMRTLGILPVFALMMIPAWIALKTAKSLREAFLLALFLGFLIPPLGYYFSFLHSFPTGASIVSVGLFYVLVSLVL